MASLVQALPYTARGHSPSPLAVFDTIVATNPPRTMDGRVRAYGCRIESLVRESERGNLSSDGRRKSSFGIARYMQPVFPNRMSRRIVERATRTLPPFAVRSIGTPVRRFMRSPGSPSPAGVAHSGSLRSYGREAYVKPVGSRNSGARPLYLRYSPASVRHP